MNQEDKDALVAGTLEWCNEQREKKGMEPMAEMPKGKRSHPLSCPCSVASGLWVGSKHYCDVGQTRSLKKDSTFNHEYLPLEKRPVLPLVVQNFTYAFDGGEFPELEES